MTTFLSAREAAELLGVRVETLYAYVSRGLLQSVPGSGRSRRYDRAEVERLKARRTPITEERVGESLHFGLPVLASEITLIENGRLFYRGREASRLAAESSFEECAALLWTGRSETATQLFPAAPPRAIPELPVLAPALAGLGRVEHFQVLLPLVAQADPAAWDQRPEAVARTGARVLRHLTSFAAGPEHWAGDLVATLARGWGCTGPREQRLLCASLVLCLDHELNVSSFTARCVASAGSTPYGAVHAGLAALQGTRHGGHTRRVEALLEESGSPDGLLDTMAARLRRGEALPGLGQKLYPEGDPRARELLRRVESLAPESEAAAWGRAYAAAGQELVGEHPTVDVGLVMTARVLHLPGDAALTLFALGRSVGWIAHAIEQYEVGQLIRPRARYTGVRPGTP